MTTHTKQLQEAYKLAPQGDTEDDYNFRHRIAGELRDMGKIIEAHEAQQDARWDDESKGEDVQAGIMGAMAQALQGVDYHVHGEQQVGCDIAAGMYVKHAKPKMTADQALLMVMLMGGSR